MIHEALLELNRELRRADLEVEDVTIVIKDPYFRVRDTITQQLPDMNYNGDYIDRLMGFKLEFTK